MQLPSQRKHVGTGTQKLRAYEAKIAAKLTKKAETPKEYRKTADAEKAAAVTPSIQIEKVTKKKVTPTIPTPVRDVAAWQAAQIPTPAAAEAQPTIQMPGFKHIAVPQKTVVQQIAEAREEALEKGFGAAEGTELSKISSEIYEISREAAEKARALKPTIQAGFVGVPVVREIVPYPIESVARLTEMGGMIPGGIETAVRKPEVIIPALTVGAVEIPTGLAGAAKEEPLQLISDIAVGSLLGGGFGKVGKAVTPKVKPLQLIEIEAAGAKPILEPITYGKALTIGETPLISYSKGKIGLGVIEAPKEALIGKKLTAFGKLETKAFEKTVQEMLPQPEVEYFKSGLGITRQIYSTKQPVYRPSEFKVLSENIPSEAKPIVEAGIKEYKGDISVFGSVTQKQQLGKFMTRVPKDIEVVVDKPVEFVKFLEQKFKKEGIEYSIKGTPEAPKVYFGKQKGIEIFSSKAEPTIIGEAYKPQKTISFGFEPQKPLVVGGVKTTRLSEQAARKFAGGTTLWEESIEPVHIGRLKDVKDIIEIGTGYVVEKNLPIEQDLIRYAEIASKKYPELISESPIIELITKEKRIPTAKEIEGLGGIDIEAPSLVYTKTRGKAVSSYIKSAAKEPTLVYPSTSLPTYRITRIKPSISSVYGISRAPTKMPVSMFGSPFKATKIKVPEVSGFGSVSVPEKTIPTFGSIAPSKPSIVSPSVSSVFVSPFSSTTGIGIKPIVPTIKPLYYKRKEKKKIEEKKKKVISPFQEFIENPIAPVFKNVWKK